MSDSIVPDPASVRARSFGRIPDGRPMSRRTAYRRKREAGLTRVLKRHAFDESFFDSWSPELAWLLGLIWSDGNLARGRNTVRISSKDRDLLETVERLIRLDDGIRPKNGGAAWEIAFRSGRTADVLRSLGLVPAKSFVANWPAMPGPLRAHFVRGLFDGDGYVSLHCRRPGQQAADLLWGICGAAPEILAGLTAWARDNGIACCPSWYRPTMWRVVVQRQDSLRTLHGLLYPDDIVPCLRRKREKFDLWMRTPRGKAGNPRLRG